jgi:hypothetical protein
MAVPPGIALLFLTVRREVAGPDASGAPRSGGSRAPSRGLVCQG